MTYLEYCRAQARKELRERVEFQAWAEAYPLATDGWAAGWAQADIQDDTFLGVTLRLVEEEGSHQRAVERIRGLDSLDEIRRVLFLFLLEWPSGVLTCPEEVIQAAVKAWR